MDKLPNIPMQLYFLPLVLLMLVGLFAKLIDMLQGESEIKELAEQGIDLTRSPTPIDPTQTDGPIRTAAPLYGYKWLAFRIYCGRTEFCSLYPTPGTNHYWPWPYGELWSDVDPSEYNTGGIHAAKSPHYPGLREYSNPLLLENRYHSRNGYNGVALVKLELDGLVIESKHLFFAQHARVVGVIEKRRFK